MKFSLTQKRGNFMMTMERKELKMVVHQEVEEWEDFLRCSLEEEGNNLVQRKASQNWCSSKLLYKKYSMDAWKQ